jgi:hypothetical protein
MAGLVAYWHERLIEFKAALNAVGIYDTVQGRQYANCLYTLA